MKVTLPMLSHHSKSRYSVTNALILVLLFGLLSGCAAERARREGSTLIEQGRYEEGLAKLKAANLADPTNPDIRREELRQTERITNTMLSSAALDWAGGRLEEAEAQFKRILAIDSKNERARAGLNGLDMDRRHAKLLDEAQKALAKEDTVDAKALINVVLLENPNNTKASQLRYQIEQKTLKQYISGPSLNLSGRRPVTLQFKDATLKMVLDALSKTTGINVLFDKEVKGDVKVTVFIKDTPVEETLDLILMQNQLEKRVLGENTVLIYPRSAAKLKDYQELKVRRFALTNADPKQVQTMLKTLFKVKDSFVDEKGNALVVRDTQQVLFLAEKLVAAMDVPDAEVMMEVEVIEISRDKSVQLGLDWPTALSISAPGTSGMYLSDLRRGLDPSGNGHILSNLTVDFGSGGTDLSVAAKFLKDKDTDSNILASPRLRARNKEKAKILIGDRKPVVSTATTSAGSGAGTVSNQSVQYVEVGIKLEVEPTIYPDGDVAIKINLEVSQAGTEREIKNSDGSTGGIVFPVSTNNLNTVLRLRDGETQIMGGLLRSEQGSSQTGIPGLSDLPGAGRLFGSQTDTKYRKELVLAITPRIIRNPRPSEADLIEMWSGTENKVSSMMSNLTIPAHSEIKGPNEAGSPAPGLARPTAAVPGKALKPRVPAAGAAQPTADAASVGGYEVGLSGPAQAKLGDKFSVTVSSTGTAPLTVMSFGLQFDPSLLKAVNVSAGSAAGQGGFEGQVHDDTVSGVLTATAGSLTAQGTVATVQFEVVGSGEANVVLSELNTLGTDGATIQSTIREALSVMLQGPQP